MLANNSNIEGVQEMQIEQSNKRSIDQSKEIILINSARRDLDIEEVGECCMTDEEMDSYTVLPKTHVHITYTWPRQPFENRELR